MEGKYKKLVPFLCLACISSARGQERQHEPLPVEKAVETQSFLQGVPITLSPDGQWVAYAMRNGYKLPAAENVRYSILTHTGVPPSFVGGDIWITNMQTGDSRNLTAGAGSNWAPAWSPDGRYLAFASDRNGEPQLWLWEKSSGTQHPACVETLSSGLMVERPYQWTSDSKHLVIRLLPQGMNLEQLLDSVYGSPRHSPNKDTQAEPTAQILTSDVGAELPQLSQTITDFDASHALLLSDIALVEITDGKAHRLVRRLRLGSFIVSPDDSQVAIMSYSQETLVHSQQLLWQLSVVSLRTNESKVLARNIWWVYRRMIWEPDSMCIAYQTTDPEGKDAIAFVTALGETKSLTLPSEFEMAYPFGMSLSPWLWDGKGQTLYAITQHSLWEIGANTGEVKKIAEISGHSLLDLIAVRHNIGLQSSDKNASAVVLTRNESSLQMGFYNINLTGGQFRRLLEKQQNILVGPGHIEVSQNQNTLAYLAEDEQHPADAWTFDTSRVTPRKVTNANPEFAQYFLGTGRLVHWKSVEGQDLKGALLLPSGYEEGNHYPLIVIVYGGIPLSTTLNQWGNGMLGAMNTQLLATRGYAVLLPDAPQEIGTPAQDLVKTVLPGIQRVVELGIADPQQIGVLGHSYGGYSTLVLIEQSKQFKAAVDISGPANLMNAYVKTGAAGGIGWVEHGQGSIGGSLWEYRDRFIENSPLFYLDSVQTPVMLIHGDCDQNVPVSESRLTFESLRRLGKRVLFAEYHGEGHSPIQWSFANQVDFNNRVIAWFDRYVKINKVEHSHSTVRDSTHP